ncbi:hypothetical protein JCM19239_1154 [Vibrio variabilis]|uniref:Uncharacterized protein n=1 Tax=Vibrio variabilis TaxID=990271 RepID=A0ABQ0JFS1_9VIBR|nr:hypothetical protein JCM19239_1154 [Vibrio variabilis]
MVPINEQSISLSKTIAIADTAMYCKNGTLGVKADKAIG